MVFFIWLHGYSYFFALLFLCVSLLKKNKQVRGNFLLLNQLVSCKLHWGNIWQVGCWLHWHCCLLCCIIFLFRIWQNLLEMSIPEHFGVRLLVYCFWLLCMWL